MKSEPEWFYGTKGAVERPTNRARGLFPVERFFARYVDEYGGIERLRCVRHNGRYERKVYQRANDELRNKPFIGELIKKAEEQADSDKSVYIVDGNLSDRLILPFSDLITQVEEPLERALLQGKNARDSLLNFGNGELTFIMDLDIS